MALTAGTKLGPYEVQDPLGAGGMGEVYRARDTRLERTVAIKVLPTHLSSDPDLRLRFDREAKAISSLNHSHICTLHDVGSQDGVDFLVMEYLEGETLAERLKKGRLPIAQAVKIAIEIADGLDKAHRLGLIHRDIKPGNVMLTKAGVKLMDFGLAKLGVGGTVSGAAAGAKAHAGSGSPFPKSVFEATMTHTSPAGPLTSAGSIVGTVQYMSPEQIEGKELDGRSDVFSLGLVMYEMVTGQRAFSGKSQASVIASILALDAPKVSAANPKVPASLESIIHSCLEKDPDERVQTAHDIKLQLQMVANLTETVTVKAPSANSSNSWILGAALGLVAIMCAGALLLLHPWRTSAPVVIRVSGDYGGNGSLYTPYGPSALMSPDGKTVVFAADDDNHVRQLWIRNLDQFAPKLLTGTEGARDAFFSPDGQWLGFFAGSKLKKVEVSGGAVVTLADVQDDRGGAWGENGVILFAPYTRTFLRQVPAAGGTVSDFSKLTDKEVTNRWPEFLPGGKVAIYTASDDGNNYENADIIAQVIATGDRKVLYHGGYSPHFVTGGYLTFTHEDTLFAVKFDPDKLKINGQPVPVIEHVGGNNSNGGSPVSISKTGHVVYAKGGTPDQILLNWLSPDGKLIPISKEARSYWGISASPTGNKLALDVEEQGSQDVFIQDLQRNVSTRFTFGSGTKLNPAWTPDGRYITYSGEAPGKGFGIFINRADGNAEAHGLLYSKTRLGVMAWHPNGKILLYTQGNGKGEIDLLWVTVEGNEHDGWKVSEPKVYSDDQTFQMFPAFSPDGRWVAYTGAQAGALQVFVQPFPGPGGRWQISREPNSSFPQWPAKGDQLFYASPDKQLMSVRYSITGNSFQAEAPKLWAEKRLADLGPMNIDYSMSPDGKRAAVLIDRFGDLKQVKVNYVFNFVEEIKKKLE
jgi:eukaryotic-like serine/threonine-protein kinase